MPTTPFGIPPPSFRLPDETRIGRVQLQVSDLQRSIEYYSGVLGLRVRSGSSGSAELGAYGDEPPLVILRERPRAPRESGVACSGCTISRSCCRIGRRSAGSCSTSARLACTRAAPTMPSASRCT